MILWSDPLSFPLLFYCLVPSAPLYYSICLDVWNSFPFTLIFHSVDNIFVIFASQVFSWDAGALQGRDYHFAQGGFPGFKPVNNCPCTERLNRGQQHWVIHYAILLVRVEIFNSTPRHSFLSRQEISPAKKGAEINCDYCLANPTCQGHSLHNQIWLSSVIKRTDLLFKSSKPSSFIFIGCCAYSE